MKLVPAQTFSGPIIRPAESGVPVTLKVAPFVVSGKLFALFTAHRYLYPLSML